MANTIQSINTVSIQQQILKYYELLYINNNNSNSNNNNISNLKSVKYLYDIHKGMILCQ